MLKLSSVSWASGMTESSVLGAEFVFTEFVRTGVALQTDPSPPLFESRFGDSVSSDFCEFLCFCPLS